MSQRWSKEMDDISEQVSFQNTEADPKILLRILSIYLYFKKEISFHYFFLNQPTRLSDICLVTGIHKPNMHYNELSNYSAIFY